MRKIDAMVADRVMGIAVYTCDEDCCEHDEPHTLIPAGERYYYTEPPHVGRTTLPRYSTDIGAAWEVVEKTLEWRGDVRFAIYFGCACRPTARFFVVNSRADIAMAHATSAPLAICLAALRAVGVAEAEIQEAM